MTRKRIVAMASCTAVALLLGCSRYVQVQMDLARQAQRGIDIARVAQADQVAMAERLAAVQRQRLDEAFDADARETVDLSADWVIEARKAYAAGLDAQHEQHRLALEHSASIRRTLDAVDRALQQLVWLQSLQTKYLDPKESDHEKY